MTDLGVGCHFYIDNEEYAFRRLFNLPRKDDELGFDDPEKHYTVVRVYWVMCQDAIRANIELEEIDNDCPGEMSAFT